MPAEVNGKASWIISEDIEGDEFKKKYEPILTELAKFVGGAANGGDMEAFQFLIHYITLIMKSGFDVLKETYDEIERSKDFEDFFKKMGIGNC